jgi:hypothetical protein
MGCWRGEVDKLVFLMLALDACMLFYFLISDLMAILSPFGWKPGGLKPKNSSIETSTVK